MDCGILPLMGGHALSTEDEQVRRHVLELMCRFETAWDKGLSEQTRGAIEQRLHEPEADGLVVLGPDRLSVTEKGRMYIRNICMAFDLRLHEKAPDTQLFSMTV